MVWILLYLIVGLLVDAMINIEISWWTIPVMILWPVPVCYFLFESCRA